MLISKCAQNTCFYRYLFRAISLRALFSMFTVWSTGGALVVSEGSRLQVLLGMIVPVT